MNNCKIKEWTIRECELLNEMKDRCLNGGKYIDENAKEKFDMLCHLEDFSIQYYNLIEVIDKALHRIQLLQMDGEVTIKDLGLIVRDLRGTKQ